MRIIAGRARSRTIEAPKGRDTRPTLDRVRENLFNILQHRVIDAVTLDLFAGSGALSLEAVSRGAKLAVMADRDRQANMIEKLNVKNLGFEAETRIIQAEWQQTVRLMESEGMKFDLVFLDPPYALQDLTQVTDALIPLLAEDAAVIVEHEYRTLPVVSGAYEKTDTRKYGYVGVSFYSLKE
ncbi:MAG: 16S rRNA (guanine(966)-N(2))-methyltransferase RsmD [Clostridia bacterium]|nr:16S rRNA (guanine(966)-N(2))-methyltransferase RsmD [Clostridia bacterium]